MLINKTILFAAELAALLGYSQGTGGHEAESTTRKETATNYAHHQEKVW